MTIEEHETHNAVTSLPVRRPVTLTQHRAFAALSEGIAAFLTAPVPDDYTQDVYRVQE